MQAAEPAAVQHATIRSQQAPTIVEHVAVPFSGVQQTFTSLQVIPVAHAQGCGTGVQPSEVVGPQWTLSQSEWQVVETHAPDWHAEPALH